MPAADSDSAHGAAAAPGAPPLDAKWAFFSACRRGDAEAVAALLAAAPWLHAARDAAGRTGLSQAACYAHPAVAQQLLDGGADANAVDGDATLLSPLHHAVLALGAPREAAVARAPGVVRALLRAGADPRALDARGASPLQLACAQLARGSSGGGGGGGCGGAAEEVAQALEAARATLLLRLSGIPSSWSAARVDELASHHGHAARARLEGAGAAALRRWASGGAEADAAAHTAACSGGSGAGADGRGAALLKVHCRAAAASLARALHGLAYHDSGRDYALRVEGAVVQLNPGENGIAP